MIGAALGIVILAMAFVIGIYLANGPPCLAVAVLVVAAALSGFVVQLKGDHT
jgi:hypothetical protein